MWVFIWSFSQQILKSLPKIGNFDVAQIEIKLRPSFPFVIVFLCHLCNHTELF